MRSSAWTENRQSMVNPYFLKMIFNVRPFGGGLSGYIGYIHSGRELRQVYGCISQEEWGG
jgi:hypothetical protein